MAGLSSVSTRQKPNVMKEISSHFPIPKNEKVGSFYLLASVLKKLIEFDLIGNNCHLGNVEFCKEGK